MWVSSNLGAVGQAGKFMAGMLVGMIVHAYLTGLRADELSEDQVIKSLADHVVLLLSTAEEIYRKEV